MKFKTIKKERADQIARMGMDLGEQKFNMEAALFVKLAAAMYINKEVDFVEYASSYDLGLPDFFENDPASDERLKTKIEPVTGIRAKVEKIKSLAEQFAKVGDKKIAGILYALISCMQGDEVEEMADHILPFLKESRKRIIEKEKILEDKKGVLKDYHTLFQDGFDYDK